MSLCEQEIYKLTGKYPHNMTKKEYADLVVPHYDHVEWDRVQNEVIKIRNKHPELDYDKTRAKVARKQAFEWHTFYCRHYKALSPELRKRFYKNEQ